MRRIIIALLALNVGYFLWHLWSSSGQVGEAAEISSGAPAQPQWRGLRPLRLADELDSAKTTDSIEASSPRLGAEPQKSKASNLPNLRKDQYSKSAPAVDTVRGSYLRLVQVAEAGCVELGPFANETQARNLVDGLVNNELSAKYEARNEIGRTVFWVYLPPAETRTQAIQTLGDLRGRGIDSFLIEQVGDIRNGISLGVFNERESAFRHQAFVHRRWGLKAEVFVDPKPESRFYVIVSGPFASGEVVRIASTLEDITGGSRSWSARHCAAIATTVGIN